MQTAGSETQHTVLSWTRGPHEVVSPIRALGVCLAGECRVYLSDCRYCSFTEVGCLTAAQPTDRAAAVFMDGCNLLPYRLEQCMHTDTTHNRQSVTLHVSTVGVNDQ